MSLFARIFRLVLAVLWYSFALTAVLAAAGFGLARLLLPMVSQYSVQVEQTASEYAGQPIKVQSLDAEWHGFWPSLVLKGVRVLDKKGDKTIIQLSKVRLGVDVVNSLIERHFRFSSLAMIGANVFLVRHKDGHISLADFDLQNHAEEETTGTDFLNRWIMGQELLSVEVENLLFQDRMNKGRLLHLANVTVMLRNAGQRHLVDAIVSLPAKRSHKLAMSMAFTGNPLQGLDWSAKFYAIGHRIDFGKLFGVQNFGSYYAALGESDFEFWGNWNHGRLDSLKGEFALQDLWLSTHKPDKSVVAHGGVFSATAHTGNKPDVDVANNAANRHSVSYEQLTGRIQWQHSENGWHLQGDRFVVSRDGWLWPASAFDIRYENTAQDKRKLKVNATFVRLQDVLALQALYQAPPHTSAAPQKQNDTALADDTFQNKGAILFDDLRHLSPTGDIRNLSLIWAKERPQDFVLHAEVEKGGLTAWGKIPGATGIKAVIDAQNDRGQVRFDTGRSRLDMPTLFRSSQELEQLQGQLQWTVTPDAWTISSSDLVLNTVDMDDQLSFDLELPTDDRSPFLNLIGKFSNGEGSQVSRYLPAKIMHTATVDWLDKAIVDARVTSGGVVFHGNTRDFPFRHHEGEFEVRFNLENGVLNYSPGWPRIENINAEVVFHNEGMSITSDSATIFRSGLRHVQVAIPDMGAKPFQLLVQGDITGETQEKLWYLQSSQPLKRRFGKYLEGIHVTGSSDLGLNITFDIGKDIFDADVNGLLTLHDNAIKVDPLGTVLTGANGQLKISPDGLSASKLSADLLGQAAQLSITTVPVKGKAGRQDIKIAATGDFDAQDLTTRYAPVLHDLVSGKAGWKVNVKIPFNKLRQADKGNSTPGAENPGANSKIETDAKTDTTVDSKKQVPAQAAIAISVQSNLKGIDLHLPAPFNKEKQRSVALNIESELYGDQRNVNRVVLGGLLDGLVEVKFADDKPEARGEIRFGGGPVALPEKTGLRLTGHIDDINVDVWRNLIRQMANNGEQTKEARASSTRGCCDWLQGADLSVSNMLIYGQTLTGLQVSVENNNAQLKAKLASKQVSGDIVVPANLQTKPIELNLDYLHLTSSALSSEGSVDPRDIPAIKAFCKSATFMQRKFGSVRLETTRLAEGLRVEQLVVKPRDTTITANGSWVIAGGKQQSKFDLQLTSDDLGKTMDDLDYVGSIAGGKGTLNASIQWPGPLTNVDLGHLQGHVALDFNNGRLLEVDPGGAGRRIFGLFSIQTLPRRLFLDFSDLFKKGFEFDEIKGDFNITQGDAYTKDFSLDGPGIETHMSGRIGLAAKDYDQKVLVTPKVSDITALLTLLSSEPVLFIVQQLLKNKINQVASFEYRLTGPWDNYKLEPIQDNSASDKNNFDF